MGEWLLLELSKLINSVLPKIQTSYFLGMDNEELCGSSLLFCFVLFLTWGLQLVDMERIVRWYLLTAPEQVEIQILMSVDRLCLRSSQTEADPWSDMDITLDVSLQNTSRRAASMHILSHSFPSVYHWHSQRKDGSFTVDIVADVINNVCTRWVCETLVSPFLDYAQLHPTKLHTWRTNNAKCDYELEDERSPKSPRGSVNRKTTKEMYQEFANLATWVKFFFCRPRDWWCPLGSSLKFTDMMILTKPNAEPLHPARFYETIFNRGFQSRTGCRKIWCVHLLISLLRIFLLTE